MQVDIGDPLRIFIGHSPDEETATLVAERSLFMQTAVALSAQRISRLTLGPAYVRPTWTRDGRLFDEISNAAMSTEHALARFWVPYLCEYSGWALFVDGDVLFRRSITDLFAFADDRYAVMCVQHDPNGQLPVEQKKRGDIQQWYPRKNWSSVMLWNCGHGANRVLTLEYLNSRRGRDLHGFKWLADAEIGPLPREWNYLVADSPVMDDPAIAHFTLGDPATRTYNSSYKVDGLCEEWRSFAQQPHAAVV